MSYSSKGNTLTSWQTKKQYTFTQTPGGSGKRLAIAQLEADNATYKQAAEARAGRPLTACRSRLRRGPLSRAKASQLSGRRITVELGNVDVGAMAEVEGGGVDRQLVQLSPKVELIAVGAAIKAVEESLAQMD